MLHIAHAAIVRYNKHIAITRINKGWVMWDLFDDVGIIMRSTGCSAKMAYDYLHDNDLDHIVAIDEIKYVQARPA